MSSLLSSDSVLGSRHVDAPALRGPATRGHDFRLIGMLQVAAALLLGALQPPAAIAASRGVVVSTLGARSTAGPIYSASNPLHVPLVTTESNGAGITVSPVLGLGTTEAGGTASFDVVLDSQPTADVVIPIASSNPAEGVASVPSLTFTSADWNVPQTVTVTGVDDAVDDGDIAYSIVTDPASSTDPLYAGIDPADVAVTNADNDAAGIDVTPVAGLVTTEAGGTASFTVVLKSQPTADVVIPVASNNAAEGVASVSSLTFTAA
ncbi:MAG TPA: calcium-binding protein, partial [Actinomycetota bacterium]|nr:calcium-binding protein [Actinomycetota bacterium]